MPPSPNTKNTLPAPTAQLGLQEWLKLLTTRGVDMRVAMGLAAKLYKSHGTIERLSELTPQKLATVIEDKDARKTVHNAVRGLASGEAVNKKRGRDSDLLEPLAKRRTGEDDVPLDIEFHPITDVEELLPLTLTTNRAPVSTAWAYTICRRMGFDQSESLSIAHVYVHISSLKHALMLGNILGEQETREAREEVEELPGGQADLPAKLRRTNKGDHPGGGGFGGRGRGRGGWKGKERETQADVVSSAQPWVQVMRGKPIIERPDGTCRAIQKGVPVGPGQAYLYITRMYKDYTPHVMGAMKLVAESYEPDELNRLGVHMYNEFKPDVVEWGQRGTLELVKVLDQIKSPIDPLADRANDNLPVKFKPEPSKAELDEDLASSQLRGAVNGVKVESAASSPLSDPDFDGERGDGIKPEPAIAGSGSDPQVKVEVEAANTRTQAEEEGLAVLSVRQPKADMSVEEYEAFLDAQETEGEGGFLEGGDVYQA